MKLITSITSVVRSETFAARLGRWVAIGMGACFIILYLVLTIKRVAYPYEIEWMEGSIIEGAIRIFHGQPLFTRPTIHFVNWLYQPLSYYLTAAAMTLVGTTCTAGRLVSFIATIVTASLVGSATYRLTSGSRTYAFLSVALFLSAFGATGYSFDLARPDPVFVVFVVASAYLVLFSRGMVSMAIAGVLLALAVLSKQQAIYYTAPLMMWVLLQNPRRAVVFIASALLVWGVGTYLVVLENGPWYFYYVYKVPRAKANDAHWGRMVFTFSTIIFAGWGVACMTIAACYAVLARPIVPFVRSRHGFVALLLVTSIGHVMLHQIDMFTYKNTALPFAVFVAIALPACLSEVSTLMPGRYRALILWPIVFQFLGAVYNPKIEGFGMPTQQDRQGADAFIGTLNKLGGNVFVRNHNVASFLPGSPGYANELALNDVLTVGDSVSERLRHERDQALDSGLFDYVITDEGAFRAYDSIPGYTLAFRINEGPAIFRSYLGPTLTTPRYVLVPRHRRSAGIVR